MGLITRTPYVAGNDVTAEGQNANEDALTNDYNGNIQDVNIAANAGILGTKLADAPNGIPTAKINDQAVTTLKIADLNVTSAKLASDPAIDANRAVTTNSIKDSAVTTAKINDGAVVAAKLGALAVIASKVKVSTLSHDFGSVTTGLVVNFDTGLDNTIIPLNLYIDFAAIPGPNKMTFNIMFNSGNGHWYITCYNPAATANSGAVTLNYIPAN